MKKKVLFGLAGSTSAAAVLTFVLTIWVVSSESGRLASAIEESAAAGAITQSNGPSEGIDVHGHWVIEIRNFDGSLAHRRVFDNDLTDQGADLLVRVLYPLASLGVPYLDLRPAAGDVAQSPCLNSHGNRDICVLIPIDFPDLAGGHMFATLETTTSDLGLVYSGSAVAAADGNLAIVASIRRVCSQSYAPRDCYELGFRNTQSYSFTQATLDEPVPVVAGQQIFVTLTISFGTAPTP